MKVGRGQVSKFLFATYLRISGSTLFRIPIPFFLLVLSLILFQNLLISTPVQAQTIHYFYDTGPNGKGRLSSVREEIGTTVTGTTEFEYDQRGNITKKTKTIGQNPTSYVFDYSYDSLNRLFELTYPGNPTRETVQYTYNNQGILERIRSITYSTDYISDFDYGAQNQIKFKRFGSGVETSYDYYDSS